KWSRGLEQDNGIVRFAVLFQDVNCVLQHRKGRRVIAGQLRRSHKRNLQTALAAYFSNFLILRAKNYARQALRSERGFSGELQQRFCSEQTNVLARNSFGTAARRDDAQYAKHEDRI